MVNYDQKLFKLESKIKWVDKKGGCCSICGYSRNLSALEFHHTKEKSKESSVILSYKDQSELDSCVLVCRICHSRIHASDNGDKCVIGKYTKILNVIGWECQNCGLELDAKERDFDLHHPPGVIKTESPAEMVSSYKKNKGELEQLIPLCKNCHREFHWPHLFVGENLNKELERLRRKKVEKRDIRIGGSEYCRQKDTLRQRILEDIYFKDIMVELNISQEDLVKWVDYIGGNLKTLFWNQHLNRKN